MTMVEGEVAVLSIKEAAGFTKVPNAILLDDRLNACDKLVAIAVASHAWGEESVCFPSNKRLARLTSLSVRAVQRSLRRLHAFEIIARTATEAARKDGTNRVLKVVWKDGSRATPRDSGSSQNPQESNQTPRCQSVTPLVPVSHPPYVSQSPKEDTLNSDILGLIQQRPPDVKESLPDPAPDTGQGDDQDADVDAKVAMALNAIAMNPEATPQHIKDAGRLLARGLRDPKSQGYYRKVANQVSLGARSALEVIDAFDATRVAMVEGRVSKPGAYFSAILKANVQQRERQRNANHPAPAAPARLPEPPALKSSSSIEEITATLQWFVAAGDSSDALVERVAKELCRAFHLDPRGSKFETEVPGKKFRCHVGFKAICRGLANGSLSWGNLWGAFEGAMGESMIAHGNYESMKLGRTLLRRLCRPKEGSYNHWNRKKD